MISKDVKNLIGAFSLLIITVTIGLLLQYYDVPKIGIFRYLEDNIKLPF